MTYISFDPFCPAKCRCISLCLRSENVPALLINPISDAPGNKQTAVPRDASTESENYYYKLHHLITNINSKSKNYNNYI